MSLSLVWLFVALRTAACQASLPFTISQSLLKLISIESVMPSNHLVLCHLLLLLPSIFPSIRVFPNELALLIRRPKCWSFSFSISLALFSHSVLSDSLQHTRLPCPLPTLRACSNSCPSTRWCHPTISSSVFPFSSCLQYFLPSGSLPMSQFFPSGGQIVGASASALVLSMNIQDWFPLGLTGLISLQSNTTV